MEGTVIRATGSWYDVLTEEQTIRATVRGRFRLEATDETNPVVIGDRVSLQQNEDGTGVIEEIRPRSNKLSRRAAGRRVGREHVIAANIDAVYMVGSVLHPKLNPGLIDRFLVMAEYFGVPAGLVFNKIDLVDASFADAIDFWDDVYSELDYPVFRTSTRSGDGLDAFSDALVDKTNVIVGPSGVGKSSLLNRIEPGLALKTSKISESTRKGVHTTTFAALYPLSRGGFIADTPGLREFGIVDVEPAVLGHLFREFEEFACVCRFPNCTHDHEPDCAVQMAAAEDLIRPERYESYLNILASVRLGAQDTGR